MVALPRLGMVLALGLILAGASWTEDQGQQGSETELMEVGPDVEAVVGPPAGPPRDGAALEAITTEVASGLRCPVCQGLSIDDSPAEQARNMRVQVRAMLGAGYDRFQIEEYFIDKYDAFVLMAPRPEGLNLLVWLAPPLLLLVGGLFGLRVLASRQAAPPAGEAAPDPQPDELDPWIAQVRQAVEAGQEQRPAESDDG